MFKPFLPSLATLTLLGLTAGCSSSDGAEKPSGGEVEAQAETNLTWGERSWKQKQSFMKEVVRPEMAILLAAQDGEKFAKVTCKTCHGDDPMAVKFKLPSPELPVLDPSDKFAAHFADKPEMTKFMMETFNPKMVELLGVEPWSPDNSEGFGCFSCHTMKTAEAATSDTPASDEASPEEAAGEASE